MAIAEARAVDITAIRGLLAEAGLPCDDLKESGIARFLIACDDAGAVVGVAGLEAYGKSGLLRALAVNPNERRRGLGAQLTRDLECLANSLGIENLYLLTTTAESFFAAHGYKRIEREQVPQELADTTEFKLLCPSTAACVRKQLNKYKFEEADDERP